MSLSRKYHAYQDTSSRPKVFSISTSTCSTKTQTVLPTVDDDAVQRAVEDVAAAVAHQEAEPQVQHFMSHDLGHRESVKCLLLYYIYKCN